MMAGIKLGGVVAVGGSILGYTGAKVISDHVVMRKQNFVIKLLEYIVYIRKKFKLIKTQYFDKSC